MKNTENEDRHPNAIVETIRIVRASSEIGVAPTNNIGLQCIYEWKGKYHYLTAQGQVYGTFTNSNDEKWRPPSHHIEPFDANRRMITLSCDISEFATEEDKIIKKQIEFFKNHDMCELNGDMNKGGVYNKCKVPFFNVIVEQDETEKYLEDFDKQMRAINSLNEMTYETMLHLMWYIGENPNKLKDLNERKLRMMLAHPENGIIFRKMVVKETEHNKSNITKLMDFLNEENSEINKYKINILKAIDEGLLAYENVGGQEMYLLNNNPIGADTNQVITYFMENGSQYELYILKKLKKEVKEVKAAPSKKSDYELLLEKVKILKEKGYIHSNQSEKETHENVANLVEYVKVASKFRTEMDVRFPQCNTFSEVMAYIDPEKKEVNVKANLNRHRGEIYPEMMAYIERMPMSKTTKS